VQFFRESLAHKEHLEGYAAALASKLTGLEERLKALNPAWEAAPPPGDAQRAAALPLGDLAELFRELSYALRWSTQVRERIVQLTLSGI
jgi:hypothetical protein